MSAVSSDFERLEKELSSGGIPAVLTQLARQLRQKKRFHELFEALKMKLRHDLKLPLLYSDSGDNLDSATRDRREKGLLDACREVGRLLLEEGAIREGWMYWRPLGDLQATRELLAKIEPSEENLDELIEVLLREGVDPSRGYELVLAHYGTCNAITTLEGEVYQRSAAELRSMISLLLRHVHAELTAAVRADIEQQKGQTLAEASLADLVRGRDWMFSEYAYHLDTTHLAATVRFARRLEDPQDLRMALDLTEYGRRLHAQFQYPGDEPFLDLYPSHALYFQLLLGENVEEALAYFRQKAETVSQDEFGTVAVETYIDLLARLGRYQDAIQACMTRMPAGSQPRGISPSLFELAEKAGCFDKFLQRCREQNDLLGFATGLMHAR